MAIALRQVTGSYVVGRTTVTAQAAVADAAGISRVEVWIDNQKSMSF